MKGVGNFDCRVMVYCSLTALMAFRVSSGRAVRGARTIPRLSRRISVGALIGGIALPLMLMLPGHWACRAAEKPSELMFEGGVTGYLAPSEVPNSLVILPPPPKPDSSAFARDAEVAQHTALLRDTPRWGQAALDADLRFPEAAAAFTCAVDVPITERATPALLRILRRSMVDAVLSTYAAKDGYKRLRPFMINGQTTCTPGDEERLRGKGSYPSGHSSIGWTWALILAELVPERSDLIMERGRSYGDSRLVCAVHWESDVIEGRTMGAATFSRLQASSQFQADIKVARSELHVARAKALAPTRDCDSERRALGQSIPGVL